MKSVIISAVSSLIDFIVLFLFPLFLCLLVPAMSQFDPGLGGIISYRQRVGSEI